MELAYIRRKRKPPRTAVVGTAQSLHPGVGVKY